MKFCIIIRRVEVEDFAKRADEKNPTIQSHEFWKSYFEKVIFDVWKFIDTTLAEVIHTVRFTGAAVSQAFIQNVVVTRRPATTGLFCALPFLCRRLLKKRLSKKHSFLENIF